MTSSKDYALNREAMRRYLGGARVSARVMNRLNDFVTSNGHEALPSTCPPLTHEERVEFMGRLKVSKVAVSDAPSPKKRKLETPADVIDAAIDVIAPLSDVSDALAARKSTKKSAPRGRKLPEALSAPAVTVEPTAEIGI